MSPVTIKTYRPFLKWAGGKHRLVPFIAEHIPPGNYQRLVEPFAGSAALSLALEFEHYLISDINTDLINLYQQLKREGKAFIDHAHSFFNSANNEAQRYYQLREEFNHSQDPITRAALFIYLNRHGFNGLCRYNRQGAFNVPFGRYKRPYFPRQEMLHFLQKAPRMHFQVCHFEEVFAQTQPQDLVYCDPPYVPLSETASFTAYSKESFGHQQQAHLAQLARQAQLRDVTTVISNHDVTLTRQLYQQAKLCYTRVQRTIAAKGARRESVPELLAVYNPKEKQAQATIMPAATRSQPLS